MAYTKQDYYEADGQASSFLSSMTINAVNDWGAQTFQASSDYDLTRISMVLSRGTGDNPGTITVEIQGVDGGGDPDGGTLGSTTITYTDVPETDANREWVNADFGTPVSLTSGTNYAIVLRTSAASTSELLLWWFINADNYANGARNFSTNGGSSWNGPFASDCSFRTYSGSATTYRDVAITIAGTSSLTLSAEKVAYKDVAITIAGTSTLSLAATIIGGTVANYTGGNTRRLVVAGSDSIWYENV